MLFPTISIAEKPDIYIKNIEKPSGKIYEGDEVAINFTIGNSGNEAIDTEVALFVDNRSKIIDKINVSLGAGEVKEETLFWLAEEGNHTVYIFADYLNKINEENEDNNIANIEISVSKPKYVAFPPPPENAVWWDEKWHYRVPVDASMFGKRSGYIYENKMVYCNINFTLLMDEISHVQTGTFSKRTFNPDSVRVVEYENDNGTWKPLRVVGREIIFSSDYNALKNANVTLLWVMEGDLKPHERRYYYVYWDTLENGKKSGEYGNIYSGIKNCEFEGNTQWKNTTSGNLKWDIGYVKDPLESDRCYSIHARGLYGGGLVWINGQYAKISESFNVPDEGQNNYVFHGKVYVSSDIEIFEWEITIDGNLIASGKVNSGWEEITKNITSYLKGKSSSLISFVLKITQSKIYPPTEPHEVNAYIDSFWIETENVETGIYENKSQGWDGEVNVENKYIAGVEGKNSIEEIEFTANAQPKEVVAKLYSPKSKLMKMSMPFPDPSFEGEYTNLFYSDEKTCEVEIDKGTYHTGGKSIMMKLSNYVGKFKIENEDVKETDTVGFRQNITHEIPSSYIPDLFFWYKIDKASSSSYINYTLNTIGSSPLSHKIYLSSLINDGEWHKYNIPKSILKKWRRHGGKVAGIEVRLVAGEAGAESTIYIDDLGYAFIPIQPDRTRWRIEDFYNFTNGELAGKWRLDVIASDASDYRITKSVFLNVLPSADLDVYRVSFPSGLKEGETGRFVVYIKNNGPKNVNESTPINVTLSLYQDASIPVKMRKSVAGLMTGESKKVYFDWVASYGNASYNGTWHVVARVNEENTIPEWNTLNNWYATKIEVEARPDMDIKMDDIIFSPMHPLNREVNISVIVHNNGYKDGNAKIRIYEKSDDRYIEITNGSIEKIIGKRSWERITQKWTAPSNGTYQIKVIVECDEEINKNNNVVIKNLRVGGSIDNEPPSITSVDITPDMQAMGKEIVITAIIKDNKTSIDKAIAHIYNSTYERELVMKRKGETDVYYINTTINRVGEYNCYIEAWDTANIQNNKKSEEKTFRIIYEGIETNPPVITGITFPSVQVIGEDVNISAYIDDESNIKDAFVYISHNGNTEKQRMEKGKDKIFYYSAKYNVGEYTFYIEAIDASVNENRNKSAFYSFEIPVDYDMDDVPDDVEISIGSNPKSANDTINVTIDNFFGYLIFISEDKYIYWSRTYNKTGDIKMKDVNGDGELDILFDVNYDTIYDHYYDTKSKSIHTYREIKKQEVPIIWIVPPTILFLIAGTLFIILRKRY